MMALVAAGFVMVRGSFASAAATPMSRGTNASPDPSVDGSTAS